MPRDVVRAPFDEEVEWKNSTEAGPTVAPQSNLQKPSKRDESKSARRLMIVLSKLLLNESSSESYPPEHPGQEIHRVKRARKGVINGAQMNVVE